ncbi:hypothetical protein ACJX0J_033613 [Zea mays]
MLFVTTAFMLQLHPCLSFLLLFSVEQFIFISTLRMSQLSILKLIAYRAALFIFLQGKVQNTIFVLKYLLDAYGMTNTGNTGVVNYHWLIGDILVHLDCIIQNKAGKKGLIWKPFAFHDMPNGNQKGGGGGGGDLNRSP